MSFHLSKLGDYLCRNKGYISSLFIDLCRLLWWKTRGVKIAVVTTGSGGVGDYLWIRNYFPLIRQRGYKVILVAMAHWRCIVEPLDGNNVDCVRYFESCQSPKKVELIYFRFFLADVFINFRKHSIADFVKSKVEYNDYGIPYKLYYEERNNLVYCKFSVLPRNFMHKLPIIEAGLRISNYVVLVEGGNTQGKLSEKQLVPIIRYLAEQNLKTLYNGQLSRIQGCLSKKDLEMVIDGADYSFAEYTGLVANAVFVVTVNTAIYHFAVQLNKPCVVVSNNEYHTLKLYAQNQEYVFNRKLQTYYDSKTLTSFLPDASSTLQDIEPQRITDAINRLIVKIQ